MHKPDHTTCDKAYYHVCSHIILVSCWVIMSFNVLVSNPCSHIFFPLSYNSLCSWIYKFDPLYYYSCNLSYAAQFTWSILDFVYLYLLKIRIRIIFWVSYGKPLQVAKKNNNTPWGFKLITLSPSPSAFYHFWTQVPTKTPPEVLKYPNILFNLILSPSLSLLNISSLFASLFLFYFFSF